LSKSQRYLETKKRIAIKLLAFLFTSQSVIYDKAALIHPIEVQPSSQRRLIQAIGFDEEAGIPINRSLDVQKIASKE